MMLPPITRLSITHLLLLLIHTDHVYGYRRTQGSMALDEDAIIGADLFTDQLEILSASVGFDGTIGVGITEDDAMDFGLAWNYLIADLETCPASGDPPPNGALQTTAAPAAGVQAIYDCATAPDRFDGFPICFSWPVLPCSIQAEHIQYTRSDGEVFSPSCISSFPNFEYNERHCIVIFDDFINRALPGEPGRLSMDRVDIIGDLLFVGPAGRIESGKGLFRIAHPDETPYVSGAQYIGSRLSPLDEVGEGTANGVANFVAGIMPNSGVDLFGTGDNLYRLRLFYSGGMSTDGLQSLRPDLFGDYFTLQFANGVEIGEAETPVAVTRTTTVAVKGLADLGQLRDVGYDLCYVEDFDNYLDIILEVVGNVNVLWNLQVLALSKGKGLYSPGGPGPTPFDNVRYTAAAPANQVVDVLIDLQNRRKTTLCFNTNDDFSRDESECETWRASGQLRTVPIGSFGGRQRDCPRNTMRKVNNN